MLGIVASLALADKQPVAPGVIDAQRRTLRFVSAGGPPVLAVRPDGDISQLTSSGLPLGLMEDASYDEVDAQFAPGDRLLLFSDGAIEIHDADQAMLGIDGLVRILKESGYPSNDINAVAVEERLLKFSNAIRLDDDLTFLEVRFH